MCPDDILIKIETHAVKVLVTSSARFTFFHFKTHQLD